MPWTFVRPRDAEVLSDRPLLDLGVGDGQTTVALAASTGLIVGVDRSIDVLPVARRSGVARVVCGESDRLSFAAGVFGTVLAADLLHHLDDAALRRVLGEVRRVLRSGGRLVAWWYAEPARPAPDAPRFPRSFAAVKDVLGPIFDEVDRLDLVAEGAGPETVGVVAR